MVTRALPGRCPSVSRTREYSRDHHGMLFGLWYVSLALTLRLTLKIAHPDLVG